MRFVIAPLLIALAAGSARADVRPMPVPDAGGGLTTEAAVAGVAVATGLVAASLWLVRRRLQRGGTP